MENKIMISIDLEELINILDINLNNNQSIKILKLILEKSINKNVILKDLKNNEEFKEQLKILNKK